MSNREHTWVILLTGGGVDSHEPQNDGANNPAGKFGAPLGRRTLLEMTLSRARSIVPLGQIVAVIERPQNRYWSEPLAMLPGANVIVQPYHRGSAIEVLLAILTIIERDPLARIIAMPSHHYVRNETALADRSARPTQISKLTSLCTDVV
jgi:mannose-1-phosphate guanylyltransferase